MSGRIKLDDAAPPRPAEPVQPSPPPPANEPEPTRPAASGAPPESTPEPVQQTPEEAQKRIDRLTWEKYEARRQAEEAQKALEAERQRYERSQPRQQAYGPQDPTEAEQRGYQRAQQELAAQEFNRACDGLFQKGTAEFGEDVMQDSVRRLNAVGWGQRPEALEEVTALPNGHAVYKALADNLDEAHRVLNLPPRARAMELARMSFSMNGVHSAPPMPNERVPNVSRAPAPLRSISANSRQPDKPLDKMSMSEFIRTRDASGPGSSHRIRR